ncbi:sialic acid-binding Ig-like lectin 9 [Microcaecilia unicolor]|uniref:Sialic acid-binding Ig-like lectin 9 n=1 Tax=Microcaecilia unicolor TaxID=1415580 RepID=A0A6P7YVU3_9AMPH|nr:sialic acid-binding Ig-like lectin 9 [Microcaecilia unicolor]
MSRAGLFLLIVLWEGSVYQIMTAEGDIQEQRELCAIIPCKFDFPSTVTLGDNPRTYWFKEAATTRTTNNDCKEESENTRDFFSLLGGLEKHNCTLRISDANEEKDGRYFFRTDGKFLYIFFKIKPFVNVIDLSEQAKSSHPVIPPAKVPLNIACTSPGRCTGSAPIITWTGTLSTSNFTANASSAHESETVLYASSITFTPSLRDHNKTLTCVVYHPAVEASMQTTVSLNVAYRSEIGNQLESNCSEENGEVKCTCEIHSNPAPILQWLVNEEVVTGNYNNETLKISSNIDGRIAKSSLSLQKKKSRSLKIQCWNANRQSVHVKRVSWWLDFRLILGIIFANLLLASLIAMAAFYCGRKVQEKENETEDENLETSPQDDVSDADDGSTASGRSEEESA